MRKMTIHEYSFSKRVINLFSSHEELLNKRNTPCPTTNGWYERYKNPVLTAAHVPLLWRYDLREESNPFLMERFGINAVFNSGAVKWKGKYALYTRPQDGFIDAGNGGGIECALLERMDQQ